MTTPADFIAPVQIHRSAQAGFTYLGLMFLIALMGITAAVAAAVWQVTQQRERERELLFIGHQFRDAIEKYRSASGQQAAASEALPARKDLAPPAYPASLDQLLLDPRFTVTRRYLRKLYIDPMTGTNQWGLVRNAQGGIVGVYSQSLKTPIKNAHFDAKDNFGLVKTYRDWVFTPAS